MVLHETNNLFLSIPTDSSQVLCFASVPVINGTMREYLQHNKVAWVVPVLQDGTTIQAGVQKVVSPNMVSRA